MKDGCRCQTVRTENMEPITTAIAKEIATETAKNIAEKATEKTIQYAGPKTDKPIVAVCERLSSDIKAGTLSDAALETRMEAAAHSACKFFGLPEAELIEGDNIAVCMKRCDFLITDDKFIFNLDQFKDMNTISFEDMSKIWSHECGHRVLHFYNMSPWAQELGADFFMGVRSEMLGLPNSNVEKVLSESKGTHSHPPGNLRIQAIEYGRETVREYNKAGIPITMQNMRETFRMSHFAKITGEQINTNTAAFINDQPWHYKEVTKAQENADYYSKEAKKAADNGDLRKASDMQSKADYYNNEVKNAKIQDILPNKELSQSLDKEINRVETSEGNEADGPKRVTCINERYLGQNHPDTGVPYVEKTVKSADGNEVVGVFPQFDSEYDAYLPENLLQESDSKQFAEANRQLKEKYDSDPGFASKFNERQCDDIENGRTPYGYVWHHSEETGKLQLVDYDTHERTRHTGGKAIWGGGRENR